MTDVDKDSPIVSKLRKLRRGEMEWQLDKVVEQGEDVENMFSHSRGCLSFLLIIYPHPTTLFLLLLEIVGGKEEERERNINTREKC